MKKDMETISQQGES